jgi:hypothetical protein
VAARPEHHERKDQYYLKLRGELFGVFDGESDAFALSAVVQAIIAWEKHVLKKMKNREMAPGEPWAYLTPDQISLSMFRGYGKAKVEDCFTRLTELGLLDVRENPVGMKRGFLLNVERLNRLVDAVPSFYEVPAPKKVSARRKGYEAGIAAMRHQVDAPEDSDPPVSQFCESRVAILRDVDASQFCDIKLEAFRKIEIEEEKHSNQQGNLHHAHLQGKPSRDTLTAEGEESSANGHESAQGDQREPETEPHTLPLAAKHTLADDTFSGEETRSFADDRLPNNTYPTEGHVPFERPTIPPHSPSLTSRPLDLPQQTSGVMDEAQDTEAGGPMNFKWFSGSYRRHCPKTKSITGMDKKRVLDFLDKTDFGGDYIDRCLEGYGESDWGREKKYPIAGFLKDPESWLKDTPAVASAAQAASAGTLPCLDIPRLAPAAPSAPKWDAAVAWNAAVVHAPKVGLDISKTPRYAAVTSDAEFRQAFEEIVKKADAMHELCGSEVEWLKFGWLLNTKAGELEPNWKKLLSGKMDFLIQKKQVAAERDPKAIEAAALSRALARWGLEQTA